MISAFSLAVEAALLVAALGLAGRAALRLLARGAWAGSIDAPSGLAAGALVLYVALLLTRQVAGALAIVAALAVFEIWCLVRARAVAVDERNAWWEWCLAALLVVTTVVNPLTEWDARSIWFYHGKVVFFAGFDAPAWRYVAEQTGFSHPFYPKLVPALAGSVARVFGFWNDYLPKFALALLTVPALLLGARLFPSWRGRALLWILVFAALRRFVWNGYMDGPLALWSLVSLLYVMAGLLGAVRPQRALLVAALGLSICSSLKVEGWVITACFAAALLVSQLGRAPAAGAPWGDYARAAAIVLVPYAAWRLYCLQVGIAPGWATLSTDYVARALSRAADPGAWTDIALEMFRATIALSFVAVAALLAVLHRAGATWWRAAAFALAASALYWLALHFVYLGTPLDLQAHLRTSVTRAVLPPRTWVLGLLLAGYAVWLGEWGSDAKRPGEQR